MESTFLLLQALRGAALSCLYALRFAASPASPVWLCTVTGYSDKTVTRALQKLKELKIVCYSTLGSGWVLAHSADLDLFFHPENRRNSGEPVLQTLESESESSSSSELEEGVLTDSAEPENVGLQEEAVDEIDLEPLLEAIHELFGEPLLLPRKQAPGWRLLLSLAAEAQHKRERLRYPARAICGSLKRGRIPDSKYREQPQKFLPGWFLERIGLEEAVAATGEESLEPASEPGESENWAYAIDQASLELPVSPGSRLSAGEAWEEARSQLRRNLPPSVYACYLSDAAVLEFLPEQGLLAVTAADPEARLWLDGRLRSNLERELRQICGRQVRLEVRDPPFKN